MLDYPLHGGGVADEMNKTLHEQALPMELAEHGLLAVGVADRATLHCLGPTHRSEKHPLALVHAFDQELTNTESQFTPFSFRGPSDR